MIKTITVNIDVETHNKLLEVSKIQDRTKSQIIRYVLKKYLEENERGIY